MCSEITQGRLIPAYCCIRFRLFIEATKIRQMCSEITQGRLIPAYCCIRFHPHLAYVNQQNKSFRGLPHDVVSQNI